jgi:serine phosphatase RsbU (regulator of sigma subunit)
MLQAELREAHEIQRRLMPAHTHRFAGFEIASIWQAARMIGGDYLAAFALPDERAALCVADVAGKGLAGSAVDVAFARRAENSRKPGRSAAQCMRAVESG